MRPEDLYFLCNRREMLVSKDLMDCSGCPLKNYPTACDQYHTQRAAIATSKMSYNPEITEPLIRRSDITE